MLLTVPQELPKVIDGGQDPVPDEPQITEEEFDLSDIMGEQLDAQVNTKEERLQQLEKQVKTCAYSKSCGYCAMMRTTIAKVLCESSISCCHGFIMYCSKFCSNWLILQECITLFLWLLWTVIYSVQCQSASRYMVAMLSDIVSSQWLGHQQDLKQT